MNTTTQPKPKAKTKPAFGRGQSRQAKAPRHGTFMERMEQRWEERRRQGW